MVTDGMSNTLMASEGYIGHAQMRSCSEHRRSSPSDPVTGTYSFTNVPPPGPNSAAALASQIDNCGTETGKVKAGGPIGHTRWANGGVYYSGFTTAMPPNTQRVDRQPGHRLRQRRPERADGLGLGRRERRRPDLHVARGQQLPPRRRQRPVRRRQRPLRQELGQPGHLAGPGHDRRRRSDQLRLLLIAGRSASR